MWKHSLYFCFQHGIYRLKWILQFIKGYTVYVWENFSFESTIIFFKKTLSIPPFNTLYNLFKSLFIIIVIVPVINWFMYGSFFFQLSLVVASIPRFSFKPQMLLFNINICFFMWSCQWVNIFLYLLHTFLLQVLFVYYTLDWNPIWNLFNFL